LGFDVLTSAAASDINSAIDAASLAGGLDPNDFVPIPTAPAGTADLTPAGNLASFVTNLTSELTPIIASVGNNLSVG
jgi:hypothetical protein